jgi:hypothetical protein
MLWLILNQMKQDCLTVLHTKAPAVETNSSTAEVLEALTPEQRLAAAISRVEADRLREGIGTLGEKTLHAVLKYFYQPDAAYHEQKIGSYFADIEKDGEIIEIQTRQLYRLQKKVSTFLEKGYLVKIVHPIPRHRWLYWIGEDGTLSPRRKSPKTGRPHSAMPELAALRDLPDHPNLTLSVLLLDVEDFRNLDGWSRDKKKGSTRFERMPLAFAEEILLYAPEDWRQLLPPALPSPFTAAEFYKKGGYPARGGYYALKRFETMGVVRQVGMKGKAFLYEVVEEME